MLSGAGALLAVAVVLLLLMQGAAPGQQTEPVTEQRAEDGDDSDPRPASQRASRDRDEPAPQPSAEMTVRVPSIGVDARVIELGLEPNGELEVPTDYDEAGLWTGGPEPGEEGAAVIAGHVDSRETGPAVFFRLDELSSGDVIQVVGDDGTRTEFVVDHLEEHPKNAFPTQAVYGWTDEPSLRLITCSGHFDRSTGHYVNNTIVFATQRRDA